MHGPPTKNHTAQQVDVLSRQAALSEVTQRKIVSTLHTPCLLTNTLFDLVLPGVCVVSTLYNKQVDVLSRQAALAEVLQHRIADQEDVLQQLSAELEHVDAQRVRWCCALVLVFVCAVFVS